MKLTVSSCRNGHIDNLKKLGEKYKKKDWGWLWVEAMAQPKLEEAVSGTDLCVLFFNFDHINNVQEAYN